LLVFFIYIIYLYIIYILKNTAARAGNCQRSKFSLYILYIVNINIYDEGAGWLCEAVASHPAIKNKIFLFWPATPAQIRESPLYSYTKKNDGGAQASLREGGFLRQKLMCQLASPACAENEAGSWLRQKLRAFAPADSARRREPQCSFQYVYIENPPLSPPPIRPPSNRGFIVEQ